MGIQNKKFVTDFIKSYFDRRKAEFDLTFEENEDKLKLKKNLSDLNKKHKKLLAKYYIVFDNDLLVLNNIFNEVASNENVNLFEKGDFTTFFRDTVEELYGEKIIDEISYKQVRESLSKIDLSLKTSMSGLNALFGRI